MPFDGSTLSETTQQLIAARDLITEHGWCQHLMTDGYAVCLVGSITRANNSRRLERLLIDFDAPLSFLARAAGLPDARYLPAWNDQRERRLDEVLSVIDRAIALSMAATP